MPNNYDSEDDDFEQWGPYFGDNTYYVGGPGDDFTSSGPGGMTSAEHQAAVKANAAQQAAADDEHAILADQGAVAFAADTVSNEFGESTMTQEPPTHHGGGGGGGGGGSSFSPSTASSPGVPVASKSSLAIILGIIAGAAFLWLKK
jgi:hypothetical protein